MLSHKNQRKATRKIFYLIQKMPAKLCTQCVRTMEKAEDLVLKNHSQKMESGAASSTEDGN